MPGEPFQAGDVIAGRFRIERVLGSGGMGAVFAAMDGELERRVAIKVMLDDADPASRDRFQREAQSAVRLVSQHAARVFDIGRAPDGRRFIVMEYLEGEDLAAHVRATGPLAPAVALDYVLQACDALDEAHRAGIVHRDIKLKNLFLTNGQDGRPLVKVLDFGIAKSTTSAAPGLTGTSAVLGSPSYMAPEQMRVASAADERSDVWSLGVCLYELLTAHVPFEGTSAAEVCALVLTEPAPPLAKWLPTVSPDLERIVGKCLAKDPDARFQSVAEVAAELAACGDTHSSGAAHRIPRPPNEAARLAALRRYRLLDTPPEEDFTFLAEIAAALCGAPCAYVTLVDENRVFYKAWHGVESDPLEAARDDDYCAWTILEDTMLHIPDLTRDARGAMISSTVNAPHLRMYCGANLVTPDGLRIGTLCVVDTTARALTDEQQRLLAKLARQVMALVELRAKKAELQAAIGEMQRLATSVL